MIYNDRLMQHTVVSFTFSTSRLEQIKFSTGIEIINAYNIIGMFCLTWSGAGITGLALVPFKTLRLDKHNPYR